MENIKLGEASSTDVQAPEAPAQKEVGKAALPGETTNGSGMSTAITIMATLIINVLILLAYDHFIVEKKFISVDVKGFIDYQQDQYLAGKITNEQLRINYAALTAVIKTIPRSKIVLMGDAVLGGMDKVDLTGVAGYVPQK